MTEELYQPPSDFLVMVGNEEISFGDHAFGRANLARLIALTRDTDGANRDWATLYLAQTDEDSPEIRQAFLDRLDDDFGDTRLEALQGLALRDPAAALPVIEAWLSRDYIDSLVLEAAEMVADPSLSPVLDRLADSWRNEDPEDWVMRRLADARAACASGTPTHWRAELMNRQR